MVDLSAKLLKLRTRTVDLVLTMDEYPVSWSLYWQWRSLHTVVMLPTIVFDDPVGDLSVIDKLLLVIECASSYELRGRILLIIFS